MSDSESAAAAPHPTTGGKSMETVQAQQNRLQSERQPYKSWRKKYRKMRVKFDAVLEENKTLFKQEHKLDGTAKRLREELDELMEILLDMNQSAAIPTDLRYDVRTQSQREERQPEWAASMKLTPQSANELLANVTAEVTTGRRAPLDLHTVRDQIEESLAEQGVRPLEALEQHMPHPIVTGEDDLPEEDRGDQPPAYLSTSQEAEYLQRLDAKLGDRLSLDKESAQPQSPHQAELTPRELERHMELLNPQSQHNWLKTHSKMHASLDNDDAESIVSHEGGSASKPSGRKRGKNLAKQVGDRAMERAYEGASPGAASGFEDDEMPVAEDALGSGKKRPRDSDGAYRVKGGRGGAVKGKRKRATEEGSASTKKARMSESFAEP